jgi:hypothetical protein
MSGYWHASHPSRHVSNNVRFVDVDAALGESVLGVFQLEQLALPELIELRHGMTKRST